MCIYIAFFLCVFSTTCHDLTDHVKNVTYFVVQGMASGGPGPLGQPLHHALRHRPMRGIVGFFEGKTMDRYGSIFIFHGFKGQILAASFSNLRKKKKKLWGIYGTHAIWWDARLKIWRYPKFWGKKRVFPWFGPTPHTRQRVIGDPSTRFDGFRCLLFAILGWKSQLDPCLEDSYYFGEMPKRWFRNSAFLRCCGHPKW